MKNIHKIAVLAVLILGGMAVLWGSGCSSTPSNPSTPTATPTATVVFNWAYPEIYTTNNYPAAYIQLQVNGSPVTDAAVTLSGSFVGSPVTAAYQTTINHSGQLYANYQFQSFTYTAGQTYIMATTDLGATASATVVAPGGVSLSLDSNGAVTLADAAIPGNSNFIVVDDSGGTTTTLSLTNVTFPVTIAPPPSTVYPGGSGTIYDVDVRSQYKTNTASNATVALGSIYLWEEKDQPVTIP